MIEMKDVMKKYSNGTTAIRNLSIVIEQGEFVLLVRLELVNLHSSN